MGQAYRNKGGSCAPGFDIAGGDLSQRPSCLDDDWEQPANARLRVTPSGAHIDGHLGLKGIQITGAGAESVSFFFDREGNLRCPVSMVLILEGTLDPQDAWVSVKTQFASPEVHVSIVGLLKYLKKRYISFCFSLNRTPAWYFTMYLSGIPDVHTSAPP